MYLQTKDEIVLGSKIRARILIQHFSVYYNHHASNEADIWQISLMEQEKKKKIIKTATVKHPMPMSKSETLFSEQFVMENLYKSMYITKRSLQREGEFAVN